ncbi:glutamate receptor 2.8 [Rosa chinensis]|uniref:glutamate receptor 2.8 n=1 Tax=Rosa chinensis TaxID=74649 RepID=UPI000D095E84|nr:glutamate receptor 2.8 [Rosa chinensis]
MINKKYTSNLYTYSLFILIFVLSSWFSPAMAQNQTIPVNVGVILHDLNSQVGKILLSCINMALSDFYASHTYYNTRLVLNTRESKRNVVSAASAALDLIENAHVQAILGPVTSMEESFVISLGEQAEVPIVSFSATSPSLTSLRSSYFFQFAQNDSAQVKALSAVVKGFGWRQVVLIYVDNEFGEGVVPCLTDALEEVDARVPYRSIVSPSATDSQIVEELYKLMTMQTRVFIVHMTADLSSRLFAKAKEIGMMSEGYVWLTTNSIPNSLKFLNSSAINSMQGVLGVQTYIPATVEFEEFKLRWKQQFRKDNPTIIGAELNIFALWAYDAAFALAMAIEEVRTTSFGFQRNNASINSSTDLESFEVSQYGPKLCQALSLTRFEGIAGNFSLVDGQRQTSTFQIVNINGRGARTVGFWTLKNGIMRKLGSPSSVNSSISSTSKGDLGPIIWPGDSISVPKGWVNPANGKKLRIGVPVKEGFTEFVSVTKDPSTNTTYVTGFSIDVFKAAVDILPYALSYELIPFANPDGKMAGTYNDLCYQVYLGKFDAVVGDETIRGNRSLYVDFTMPYTESGVVMVVPLKDIRRKSAWVFLKPLTWDLWLTTSCFFVLIGFVVWVLEHRINADFRGPPSYQVGTSIWFSFSTMVFSHRERVVSNLARFVMIIWVFVMLILTQSYTANLASLLTVQKLYPVVTDLKHYLRNGDTVGYQNNTYIYDILREIGFDESKLKAYKSVEECDALLSKGSENGGIAAAIDETPNMKLFLAKYCSKYTMVGPIFKTDGFAFVFPKGSPLLHDVSQAILNVTEGDVILNIENKWFNKEGSCQDNSNPGVSSNRLGLETFWGLFLIAGVASVLALIIFLASFLYEHRHVLILTDPGASTRGKFRTMLEIFNEKDFSSHTFKTTQRDRVANVGDAVNAILNNCLEIPLGDSSDSADPSSQFIGEQQNSTTTPSTGQEPAEVNPATEVDITNDGEMEGTPERAQHFSDC